MYARRSAWFWGWIVWWAVAWGVAMRLAGWVRAGWMDAPYASFWAEATAGVAYFSGGVAVWFWWQCRDARGEPYRLLPRWVSLWWRTCVATGMAHGFLVLPQILVTAAVLPEDDRGVAVSHWVASRFFLAMPVGPMLAGVVALPALLVVWGIAGVRVRRLGHDRPTGYRFMALTMTVLAVVLVAVIFVLIGVPHG